MGAEGHVAISLGMEVELFETYVWGGGGPGVHSALLQDGGEGVAVFVTFLYFFLMGGGGGGG